MNNKTGFTLVEILTVVLIIGILTSVALPQYRRAIQKAKATEAVSMLRVIHDSSERLAAYLGYRNFNALATADSSKAVFGRMDMFDGTTLPCTIEDTTLNCGAFTYYLNRGENYLYALKNGEPYAGTQIRLYRSAVPSIKCAGEVAACDVYNLEYDGAVE